MEQWERNREKSKKYGADSSALDMHRRDSNADIPVGDAERPPDPMNYCPGNKDATKQREER